MITGSVEKIEQLEGDKATAIKDTIDRFEKDFGKTKGAIIITYHEGKPQEPQFVAFGMSRMNIMMTLQAIVFGVSDAFRNENKKQETKSEESSTENQAQA